MKNPYKIPLIIKTKNTSFCISVLNSHEKFRLLLALKRSAQIAIKIWEEKITL
jgi:hypothetical protein